MAAQPLKVPSKYFFCDRITVVRFEAFTAVVMNSSIFWDITLCSPLKVNRHFDPFNSSDLKIFGGRAEEGMEL
jgi:hypothetical protein